MIFNQMQNQNTLSLEYIKKVQQHEPVRVFANPRIQSTLQQISLNLHNCEKSRDKKRVNKKQNNYSPKQSFRSFIQSRRNYRFSHQRLKFVNLKKQMEELTLCLQSKFQYFQLSKFAQLKQKIILQFWNSFVDEESKDNIDKAELLVLIWDNLFRLVQSAVQKICYYSKLNESANLKQQVDVHQKYQKILSICLKQKREMKEQFDRRENFTKMLVAKLRQYKKTIKKLEQNLRIASNKLSQFRRGYIQIEIQCINLNMELRNLGQQTAKAMVRKKMALNMQKLKQYKILPSRKKVRKQLKSQKIEPQSTQNKQIKQQFYQAFKNNINTNEKNDAVPKIVDRIIESILDKEQTQPIDFSIFNENLVSNKMLAQEFMVDKQTDMQGFEIERSDKKVGINPQQLFYYQMTKIRGVQTQTIEKPPPIKTENCWAQCDFKTLKVNNFNFRRTIDLSFLFQNTGKHSTIKLQQITTKQFVTNLNEKTRKIIVEREIDHGNVFNEVSSELSFENNEQQKKKQVSIANKATPSLILEQSERLKGSNPVQMTQFSKNFEIKRRIKKLASTFNNKVSFSNNFVNERQRRYTKGQFSHSQITERNQEQYKQSHQQNRNMLVQIDQQYESKIKNQGNSIQKSTKKIKNDIPIYQNRKKNLEQAKRSTKYSFHKGQKNQMKKFNSKQRSLNTKKNNINMNIVEQDVILRQNPSVKTNQKSRQQNRTSSEYYPNKTRKQFQINFEQLYRDIFQQIQKQKQKQKTKKSPNDGDSHKLKELNKMIQLIWQAAWKQIDNNGLIKHFLYYAHQAINSRYGTSNNLFLKKKVVTFIKEIHNCKQNRPLFKLFLLMCGISENCEQNYEYFYKNNQIILRICSKMYANWKYPLKISELVLNHQNLEQTIQKQLIECEFSQNFSNNLIKNLQQNHCFNKKDQPFTIILDICEYFINKQSILANCYEPVFTLIDQSNFHRISKQFVYFLIQLHFFSQTQNKIIRKNFQKFCDKFCPHQYVSRAQFAYFGCKNQMLDLSRLFHKALTTYKIKQTDPVIKNMSIKKLRSMYTTNSNSNNIINNNNNNNNNRMGIASNIVQIIFSNCQKIDEHNTYFHTMIKKNILILIFLKIQDMFMDAFVANFIGVDLVPLWGIAS